MAKTDTETPDRVVRTIRIPRELLETLEARARVSELPLNEVITRALSYAVRATSPALKKTVSTTTTVEVITF